MKGQRADPIASQEYQFEFPKGQIAVGESFKMCVEGPADTQIVRLQIRLLSSQRK